MPEEINRIVTDSISDILFAPTATAIHHLKTEGLEGKSFFTGDVMYDSVVYYKKLILKNPDKYKTSGIPDNYYLATIHRAENTDQPEKLHMIFSAFAQLDYPVILPVHPRTRKLIGTSVEVPANVKIINPVGYLEMMKLTMDAAKIFTDSGGLQKEAYFLQRPCITLRTETEWVETLHDDWNTITGCDTGKILQAAGRPFPVLPPRDVFGDGRAAESIIEKIQSF